MCCKDPHELKDSTKEKTEPKEKHYGILRTVTPVVWFPNVVGMIAIHLIALECLVNSCTWYHFLVTYTFASLTGLGITAGAHRLWAHKAYKAKFPLRVILMLLFTSTGQNSIYTWCRDHRLHHKFTDTDADPHQYSTRGAFFAHMGWLMLRKHPQVIEKGKTIDCSDLLRDPVVAFNHKHYNWLSFLLLVIVPTALFKFSFESTLYQAFSGAILRWVITLHSTWCVNSLAHAFGDKPYDKDSRATENTFTTMVSLGEGYHNYHHAFPQDYRAAELPLAPFNIGTIFINLMSFIGQAYDLKAAPRHIVERRKEKVLAGR